MTAPRRRIAWLFVALLLLPAPAVAAGGGGVDGARAKNQTAEYTAGVQAIEAKDFARAITLLEAAVPGDDVLGRAALQRRAGIAGDEREEPLHQPDAGVVDRAPQGRGQTRSAGLRGPWKPGIAEFERDAFVIDS